jgi:hypothetical protein
VIDYDQGSILSHDVELAIEDYLKSRHAKATAVIVASATHERLRQVADEPLRWDRLYEAAQAVVDAPGMWGGGPQREAIQRLRALLLSGESGSQS